MNAWEQCGRFLLLTTMSTLPPKKPPFVVGRRVAPPKPRVSAKTVPVDISEKPSSSSKDDSNCLKPDTARTRPRSNTVGSRPILSSCENKPSGSRKVAFATVSEAKPADPASACPTPAAVRISRVRIADQPDHTSDQKPMRTRPRAMTVTTRPASLASSRAPARSLSQISPEEMARRARYADIEVFHTFAAGSSGCVRIGK